MFSPMSWFSIGSITVHRLVDVEHLRGHDLLAAEGEQLPRQRRGTLGGVADRLDAEQGAVGIEVEARFARGQVLR